MSFAAKPYKVIRSDSLSKTEDRFIVVDSENSDVTLDDARGYGYKTIQAAHRAFLYKSNNQKFLKNEDTQNTEPFSSKPVKVPKKHVHKAVHAPVEAPPQNYPDVIVCREFGVDSEGRAIDSELVPTSQFKWGYFPFAKFNPIQSSLFEWIDQDVNIIAACATSGGKTVVFEMVGAYEVRSKGDAIIYCAPMKALVFEKAQDWTDPSHHFADLGIEECSGDNIITDSRAEQLRNAKLISITPECLSSRMRTETSKKSSFITNCGLLALDELHLINDLGRGGHYELTLMQMSRINPNCRFVGLSATAKNARQIGQWLSSLNGKKTVVLESTYRPVKLKIDHREFTANSNYDYKMLQYIYEAYSTVAKNPKDKHVIFFHDKGTQHKALKVFNEGHLSTAKGEPYKGFPTVTPMQAELYNADLDKDTRIDMVSRFINDPSFNVLVSTSSLGVGCNLPAKRVIICGAERGMSRVELGDMLQMAGRAGRPRYDTEGYVTYILPHYLYDAYAKFILQQIPTVNSSLGIAKPENWEVWKAHGENMPAVVKNIAFHIIAEIKRGDNTRQKIEQWYNKTFAYFQDTRNIDLLDSVINRLMENGVLKEAYGDTIQISKVGETAAALYADPFDVADLHRNVTNMPQGTLDDHEWGKILSDVASSREGFISKAEVLGMRQLRDDNVITYDPFVLNGSGSAQVTPLSKHYTAWRLILEGKSCNVLSALIRNKMTDGERTVAVLQMLDGYYGCGLKDHLKVLALRIKYGVPEYLVSLVRIPGIGKTRAVKLFNSGVRTPEQFLHLSPAQIYDLIGIKDIETVMEMRDAAANLEPL